MSTSPLPYTRLPYFTIPYDFDAEDADIPDTNIAGVSRAPSPVTSGDETYSQYSPGRGSFDAADLLPKLPNPRVKLVEVPLTEDHMLESKRLWLRDTKYYCFWVDFVPWVFLESDFIAHMSRWGKVFYCRPSESNYRPADNVWDNTPEDLQLTKYDLVFFGNGIAGAHYCEALWEMCGNYGTDMLVNGFRIRVRRRRKLPKLARRLAVNGLAKEGIASQTRLYRDIIIRGPIKQGDDEDNNNDNNDDPPVRLDLPTILSCLAPFRVAWEIRTWNEYEEGDDKVINFGCRTINQANLVMFYLKKFWHEEAKYDMISFGEQPQTNGETSGGRQVRRRQ